MARHEKHPTLLSTREAAQLARCSLARIYQAAHNGELACVQYSISSFRYYRHDVLSWMRAHRRAPFKDPPQGYARNPGVIVNK